MPDPSATLYGNTKTKYHPARDRDRRRRAQTGTASPAAPTAQKSCASRFSPDTVQLINAAARWSGPDLGSDPAPVRRTAWKARSAEPARTRMDEDGRGSARIGEDGRCWVRWACFARRQRPPRPTLALMLACPRARLA